MSLIELVRRALAGPILWCLLPVALPAQPLLLADLPGLGDGLSAIELDTDGRGFTAISDRGWLLRGEVIREAGVPVAARITQRNRLRLPDGTWAGDSEGLAIGRGGELIVSYEGKPPALRVHGPDGIEVQTLPLPPGFEDWPPNNGPEALAAGADGAIYIIPEIADAAPVWRLKNGRWAQIMTLEMSRRYLPVGADIGPDGALYILERYFAGLGFASQIRRLALDGSSAQVMLHTELSQHGNLEGISVWRDGEGRIRATMVEDNNELPILPGGLVEYVLGP